ncbi:replication endonuclease [Vibrio cionasavignyae]|uniref:replication endonuclease n=1 Tax=Vibrio cionasavignyae TaxID=2910252 RepID=UPI003D0AB587
MLDVINLTSVDRDDKAFVQQRLCCFPEAIQRILLTEYLSHSSKFARNSYLRVTVDAISRKLSIPLAELKLNVSEDDLREQSKHYAQSALTLRRQYLNDSLAIDSVRSLVRSRGVNPALSFSLTGELARYGDKNWWLRKLRKALRQNIEAVLHHLNQVNKKKSLYCSNPTLNARIAQKQYQQEWLANTIATNELGQSFSLLELSQKGVADPKIRKGELMMRARGFEDLAKSMNHEAAFLTLTCPSKYHRAYATSGHENPKWGGFTPLDGQRYLNKQWVLVRSKLNRLGVRFYGFRVVEPQHDGTPHWHLLLFVEANQYQTLIEVMKDYALREDSDEKGASKHRFTEVKIDPAKGSATGYIAKYISKNIDGADLDSGIYGEDPLDAAARVDAWASCWGIRQFQQLGGCSITVWRELRRLKSTQNLPEQVKAIFEAADKGDWKGFLELMGGVFCHRKEQLVQPYYELSVDTNTGVVKTTAYSDEELTTVLKGVFAIGEAIVTRSMQWRFESKLARAF